ncbi:hypothetical protein ACFQ10_54915 [Streptomyces indonesiensis]
MSWIRPVANGLRTDHPVPGLPFINDERLPLDNPDAIERTGRNQGEGLWGRTDSLRGGGWVAFTTEPKNRAYAWAVHQHPTYGRTVLLIRDQDMSDLHHDWMFGRNGFLYRHGGYWWDGAAWHRPGQVVDRAYEGYDARPVEDAVTVTAADLLARPGEPGNARIMKIADFTAPEEPLPHWHDHLALWAASRRPAPCHSTDASSTCGHQNSNPPASSTGRDWHRSRDWHLTTCPTRNTGAAISPSPRPKPPRARAGPSPSPATGPRSTKGATARRRSCPARPCSVPNSRSVSSLTTTA